MKSTNTCYWQCEETFTFKVGSTYSYHCASRAKACEYISVVTGRSVIEFLKLFECTLFTFT